MTQRPPLRLLRLSAQLYNEIAEFDLLAELTLQALRAHPQTHGDRQ